MTRAVLAPDLLRGKVCVISGSGTGLGRAAALEMGRLGATVVGCARRVEPIEATAARIREAGGAADATPLDIRDDAAVDTFFDDVLERHGRVDVLVSLLNDQLDIATAAPVGQHADILEPNQGLDDLTRLITNEGAS